MAQKAKVHVLRCHHSHALPGTPVGVVTCQWRSGMSGGGSMLVGGMVWHIIGEWHIPGVGSTSVLTWLMAVASMQGRKAKVSSLVKLLVLQHLLTTLYLFQRQRSKKRDLLTQRNEFAVLLVAGVDVNDSRTNFCQAFKMWARHTCTWLTGRGCGFSISSTLLLERSPYPALSPVTFDFLLFWICLTLKRT